MHLLGYARVSTRDQNLELQLDALKEAGCRRVFEETASGANKARPQLREAQRIGLAIDPISGEDLQKLAADIFATPAPFVEKVKDALVYRAP